MRLPARSGGISASSSLCAVVRSCACRCTLLEALCQVLPTCSDILADAVLAALTWGSSPAHQLLLLLLQAALALARVAACIGITVCVIAFHLYHWRCPSCTLR
jgi:hypothetical protein